MTRLNRQDEAWRSTHAHHVRRSRRSVIGHAIKRRCVVADTEAEQRALTGSMQQRRAVAVTHVDVDARPVEQTLKQRCAQRRLKSEVHSEGNSTRRRQNRDGPGSATARFVAAARLC